MIEVADDELFESPLAENMEQGNAVPSAGNPDEVRLRWRQVLEIWFDGFAYSILSEPRYFCNGSGMLILPSACW